MAVKLDLIKDGAVCLERAALFSLPALEKALANSGEEKAGVRLYDNIRLANLLSANSDLRQSLIAFIGPDFRPVRAILFDKSHKTNWALGWHQDRTIAVKERRDITGYGPWSMKAGITHVEPPFEIIENMITARIHLDDVPDGNAPLLIVRGSHQLGKLPETEIADLALKYGQFACTASRGDVWLYATPIVHASAASKTPSRRRVLHVDFSNCPLIGGLEWQGIG